MGVKIYMLVIADTDAKQALAQAKDLDENATFEMARTLFPGEKLIPLGKRDLSYLYPRGREITVACYPGVRIICAFDFALHRPSQLPVRFLNYKPEAITTLHIMNTVSNVLAYAVWHKGQLQRAVRLSGLSGVVEENMGTQLPFEVPYWAGQHPPHDLDEAANEKYPFPFDPSDLSDAALLAMYGFVPEDDTHPDALDPRSIKLLRYERVKRRWWKFWV